MRSPSLSVVLARLGIASAFLGFGIWELIVPNWWTTYVPAFASSILPATTVVLIHGVMLTVTGVAVLAGWLPRLFTTVAALIMLEICLEIYIQEGFTDIFIRDVAIFFFAAAMVAHEFAEHRLLSQPR